MHLIFELRLVVDEQEVHKNLSADHSKYKDPSYNYKWKVQTGIFEGEERIFYKPD